MKKILALLLAALLLAGMMSTVALAAEGDTVMTVTGLEDAASVKYYKIIEWDETVDGGWKWAEPYASNASSFTADLLKEITGTPKHEEDGQVVEAVPGKITMDAANLIASVSNSSALNGGTLSEGSWTATATKDQKGLYMVVPTSKAGSDVIYNPVFIAANHGKDANSIGTDSAYAEGTTITAMAKKTTETVNKTADKYTFNGFTYEEGEKKPGDTITFTVTTTLPVYADNYTNPVFKISDQVSSGIQITKSTIAIAELEAADWEITSFDDTNKDDFVVSIKEAKLKSLTAPLAITLTYKALITDDAPKTVNEQNNKVKINFSNGPDDDEGHGEKRDKTRHWTFSIDASVLGNEEYHTSELVKVGLNPDGTEKTKTTTYDNGTEAHALDGATFQLKQGDKVIREVTTAGGNGYIHFEGLDVGTYTLVETAAPAGYVRDMNPHTVVVAAEVAHDLEETDSEGYKYTTDRLVSYSITIDGTTSSYTFDNGTLVQNITQGDKTTKINNTQGLELPSTGGMGTTILYVGGSILVLLAVILLVTKRRMNANDD